MHLVLGIESSCDETAAAVIEDGTKIRSNVISSQITIHKPYGGVVPELASREHLAKIDYVVEEALSKAEVTLNHIDGIAVTYGPGLVGSLLVGIGYAKSLAYALNKPLVGINHLEGHIYSVVFENPPIQYPALALVVSGGHTSLFLMPEEEKYKVIARTRDDAAGEAFDKIAKLVGLGYPGGPIIDKLAKQGDPHAVKFAIPRMGDGRMDFSFSGLKTAVLRYVKQNNIGPLKPGEEPTKEVIDLAASFQRTVVATLIDRLGAAATEHNPRTVILSGGVACNSELRAAAKELCEKLQIPFYVPRPILTTDNAAMIAAAGYPKLLRGERANMSLSADVSIKLQNVDVEDAALAGHVRYRL
ncbi:MAG TPA: tRNA (adenosine(37)-N6)-threonylcarbamoyltransferase complex transferase subunit TsaD [Blastocatellia bacterium]|nr:tRNA (adenosine(37)-N6)-threonylcarbamoyltransferase complex transferase subunit TsaD [Blastocatellia bacterium]